MGGIFLSKSDPNKVYESYDVIADWYRQHRSYDLFEKAYLDKLLAHLKPGDPVLDLGCGTGKPIGEYILNKGFKLTGIDGSARLLEHAKKSFPDAEWFLEDMRKINLTQKFKAIIAWDSFFHLPANDQVAMFLVFEQHIAPKGVLMFTSGPSESEEWSVNGGISLFHASLSPEHYTKLLNQHRFEVLVNKLQDEACRGHSVWLAKYRQ